MSSKVSEFPSRISVRIIINTLSSWLAVPKDRTLPLVLLTSVLASLGWLCGLEITDESVQINVPLKKVEIPAHDLLYGKKMDINRVTPADLKQVPRLPFRVAEAIVKWRDTHGGIQSISELGGVKGVGPKTLEKLKQYVEVR